MDDPTAFLDMAHELCAAFEEIIRRYGDSAETSASALAVVTRLAVRGLLAERGPDGAAAILRDLADEVERTQAPAPVQVH